MESTEESKELLTLLHDIHSVSLQREDKERKTNSMNKKKGEKNTSELFNRKTDCQRKSDWK